MKNIVAFFLISLSMISKSCNKAHTKINTVTVSATVKMNETYQYDLGGFGIEDGAGINRQASHYQISVAERQNINIIYTYKPSLNYIGTDEVELKSTRGSNGSNIGNDILITIIKLTITN